MVSQRAIAASLLFLLALALENIDAQTPLPQPPPGDPPAEQQGPPPPHEAGRRKGGGPPPLLVIDERFKKMIDLALLPESDVEQNIDKLPMVAKMTETEKQKFTEHVKGFRNRIRKEALDKAEKIGITLSAEKQDEFVKNFWEKRIEMEKKLNEEIEPRRKKLMQDILDELSKKYGANKSN